MEWMGEDTGWTGVDTEVNEVDEQSLGFHSLVSTQQCLHPSGLDPGSLSSEQK